MENEVTEPDRRIKPQGKSVWAASFRKNFKIRRQFQQQLHQTGALHWNYIKWGCGKTLWNTVHVEIQPENVFWMLPWSFKLLILPFNFIFKRCVYLTKSQGEDIFYPLFSPCSIFGALLWNYCHSHSLLCPSLHSITTPAVLEAVMHSAANRCWVSAGHRAGHCSKCSSVQEDTHDLF